eukprot:1122591-Prorocentrum_lima.AAC.1
MSTTNLLEADILFKVKFYHLRVYRVMEGHQDMVHRWMPINQVEGLLLRVNNQSMLWKALFGRTSKWGASPPSA